MSDQAAQSGVENPRDSHTGSADIKLLIESVVKSIVDVPEEVSVDTENERGELIYNLRVAQKDVGKVIGKQGRTVRALRTLVEAASGKQNQRATLEIIEDENDDSVESSESGKPDYD